ncbi:ABC transporter substrate-binding protein [Variovorax sp. PCZ-1]|uniref:ABC transporter substrate-binding protein n=1 Tax=Variovorax sp. PCZ-1 TaxID=2835533 RepID=UPI001BCF3E2C|nr:ABC transporter substrate-binding protein [Variovorax sp. PCZ-1]MBS7807603.1 ABC transporter substrate-binding protein [Variovorax sp. PCZ-1]
MNITRRRLHQHALSAAAFLATAPVIRTASAQSGKILLGQSCPLTGAAAQLGIQFNAGATVYFDLLNAKGGAAGRPIEILAMDDGYEPNRCAENTNKLIDQDVFALFGYIGTPTSLAALPLATKANIPFIAPFTGAMSLRDPFNKLAFHLRASYDDETASIVNQLNTLGLKNIAVFYQNDAYGKAGLDGATKALAKLNNKPVALATVERNSVDVAGALKTLLPAKPDAIIQVSAYKSCAAFIREARKAGYGGQFFNVSFVGTKALSDELGKDGAGVVITQVVPSPYNAATAIVREFQSAVASHGKNVNINYSSFEGYLAAKMFADGLNRAGSRVTRESLINGLEAIGRADYGGFQVSLSGRDHVASSFVEKSMLTGDGKVRV